MCVFLNVFRSYFYEVCSVCEADEYFGINEYSDLVTLTKPVVYMTVQEICDTHRILVEYLDRIAPPAEQEPNDPLREIFKLLHFEPNLDSLTENLFSSRTSTLNGNSAAASSHDTLTRNNLNKNTQLCLTLTNRFMPSGDEKTDLNSLFIRFAFLFLLFRVKINVDPFEFFYGLFYKCFNFHLNL